MIETYIYKTLIRSIIDYGCAAYNSANKDLKSKLDRIQSQALRIACGALRCTSVASVQVECGGEMPLQLRRESIINKYALNIKSVPNHPAKKLLNNNDHRINPQSFYNDTRDFMSSVTVDIPEHRVNIDPPWHRIPPAVCTKLLESTRGMSPDTIRTLASDHIHSHHKNTQKCFTDGSRMSDGRVTCRSGLCVG